MRQPKTMLASLGLSAALMVGIAPAVVADTVETTKERVVVTEKEYQRPDAWVTTKVKAKLIKESGLSGLKIKVSTHDGAVQLAGFVKKPEQITLAEEVASSIEGVKSVKNDLRLKE